MSGTTEPAGPGVLIVDDDPAIRALLRQTLAQAGYGVSEAATATQALAQRAAKAPDLALLDLGLPDRDGLEILPQLVAAGLAVVVLSARDATAEKVAALDLGASDYVTKPFDPEEILARVRTALRHRARLAGVPGGQAVLRFADVEIDLAARQVRKAGAEVHLAPKEYAFLAELAGNAGRVVTHAQLLRTIWGPGHETDVEYLRVAARGIRRKLESDRPPGHSALRNEPGIGYRLDLARG
ncbi:response regulator [Novosphingobium capsulatum]|uniref:response regulator n=1 Tax=Novosphingobium capsulatum TaxID=13688 RepID=UPI000B1F74D8|nr:response regulator transcription factor [Novosphingobium capsulatum]WQD94477.1 response regulator transcription factor [Novosphingobium capsulatum]